MSLTFKISIKFLLIKFIITGFLPRAFSYHSYQSEQFSHNSNPEVDTFDFIIVGGGNAGCTLASRLSENGKYSVLLLEAGSMPHPNLDIPALAAYYVAASNYTAVHNIPSANAGILTDGVKYVRGRVLGGSSQVNHMFFNRGSPYDYDNWANITEDPSWNYKNLLPYFLKSENYMGIFPSPTQHGSSGPINVEKPSYAPGVEQFLQAGRQLGYPVTDPNGPQIVSFNPGEFSRKNGRRISSFTGYIKPFLFRRNLKVVTDADATKIEFRRNRAVGVYYKVTDPKTGRATLKYVESLKEIIVSGGVVGSPVLLQKSGIGPRKWLKAASIPLNKDLPVGENAHDHPEIRVEFIINDKSITFDAQRDLTPENLRLYKLTGEGPYSTSHGYDGIAFISSSNQLRSKLPDWPDIEYHYLSSREVVNISPPILTPSLAPWETTVSISTYMGRPKSRGIVRINPVDKDSEPIVDFGYFSDPEGYDMEVALSAIKTTIRLVEETASYKKLEARMPEKGLKECEYLGYRSDNYWRCFVRQVAGTAFHGVGSCRMGRGRGDKKAVVDPKLRVLGIEGLRVVDASIMPDITNANLQAAVYGIAEKASDMILESWN